MFSITSKIVETIENIKKEIEALKETKPSKEEKLRIEEETERLLKRHTESNNCYVILAGMVKKDNNLPSSWNVSSDKELFERISEKEVEDFLKGLASLERIKILKSLLEHDKYSKDLTEELSMEGGALYHHLNNLEETGYIEKRMRGKYHLSGLGVISIFSTYSLALALRGWKIRE